MMVLFSYKTNNNKPVIGKRTQLTFFSLISCKVISANTINNDILMVKINPLLFA